MALTSNSNGSSNRLTPLFFFIAIIAIALFFAIPALLPSPSKKPPQLLSGTLYPKPKPIQAFKLTDHRQQIFNAQSLQGKWHLFFMGFTHCPHICPTEMLLLSKLYKQLTPKQQAALQIVMVSTDPLRDTPEVMKEFLSHYHADFLGLTGSKEEIALFAKQFAMPFLPSKETDKNKNYEVNHSATFYLTNPDGALFSLFSTPHDRQKISTDLAKILAQ